jgi:hypothetical protein
MLKDVTCTHPPTPPAPLHPSLKLRMTKKASRDKLFPGKPRKGA